MSGLTRGGAKRGLRISVIFVGLAAILILLIFRLSPWPTVAVIAYLFSSGDHKSEAALAKHVPVGIVTKNNLPYGSAPDEVFDLFRRDVGCRLQPAIVWVHGGAWIAGSKDGVANYLRVLAGRGYTTLAVEYSTGRRGRYPLPVQQVNSALAHIVTHAEQLGINPKRIVLAGDSAGAQIAAQVALLNTDAGYARSLGIAPAVSRDRIKAVLALSGAYDIGSVDLDGDYGWFVRTVLWAYSGSRNFLQDERFRLASVTDHVGPAFPPTFLSSGNGDPLAPQAERLAHKLRAFGVPVETLFFPDDREPALPHEYQFNLDDQAGTEALDRMLAFSERWTGAGARPGGDVGPGAACISLGNSRDAGRGSWITMSSATSLARG